MALMLMGVESNSKATPKIIMLNKASKLAEAWVNSMSKSTISDHNEIQLEGRPARLGLGAKVAPKVNTAPAITPIERKLLATVKASKKPLAKDSKKDGQVQECESSSGDECESRTSAFAKKRESPLAMSIEPKKQKRN